MKFHIHIVSWPALDVKAWPENSAAIVLVQPLPFHLSLFSKSHLHSHASSTYCSPVKANAKYHSATSFHSVCRSSGPTICYYFNISIGHAQSLTHHPFSGPQTLWVTLIRPKCALFMITAYRRRVIINPNLKSSLCIKREDRVHTNTYIPNNL